MTNQRPPMDFGQFVRLVLDTLEAAKIRYLIGGAIAVWAWGELRTTQDVDLVIDLPLESVADLSRELEKRDMLVPVDIILDVLLRSRGDLAINAIHMYTGYKAELFLLRPGDAHRATALAHRCLVDMGPPLGEVYVHAPEDLILNKLRCFRISEQPKHVRDIASIMLTLGEVLNSDYITEWAERLGLLATWAEMQARVADILGQRSP